MATGQQLLPAGFSALCLTSPIGVTPLPELENCTESLDRRSPFGIDQIEIAPHWAEACFGILHEPHKEARPEGDTVSSLIHPSMRQYAVISIRTAPLCERLVIAYADEATLRDLLAEPSIVALGYSSREEAEASASRYGSVALPPPRKSAATLATKSMLDIKAFVYSHLRSTNPFRLGVTQRRLFGLLQHMIAAAVVLFYSKNLLATAIRALVSF